MFEKINKRNHLHIQRIASILSCMVAGFGSSVNPESSVVLFILRRLGRGPRRTHPKRRLHQEASKAYCELLDHAKNKYQGKYLRLCWFC